MHASRQRPSTDTNCVIQLKVALSQYQSQKIMVKRIHDNDIIMASIEYPKGKKEILREKMLYDNYIFNFFLCFFFFFLANE